MSTPERHTLTDAQRQALYAAAEAGGLADDFGGLLCKLAELLGFALILGELGTVLTELEELRSSGILAADPQPDGDGA